MRKLPFLYALLDIEVSGSLLLSSLYALSLLVLPFVMSDLERTVRNRTTTADFD